MSYKKNNIKRVLYSIFSIILIFSIFVAFNLSKNSISRNCISEVIKVYDIIQKINKLFSEKITFKTADYQPILDGSKFKFLLQGSDGNMWLFKEGHSNALAAFKLAYIFDINSPEMLPLSLVVNGKNIYGTVQKFIESDKSIDLTVPSIMKQRQREMIKLQIFHWLLNKKEDGFYHLIVDKKGDIYSIDLEGTLEYFIEAWYAPPSFEEKFYCRKILPLYEVFNLFWDEYLKSSNWRLDIPFDFIYYIENFDSDFLSFLLNENGVNSADIVKFLELKDDISDEFKKFLLFINKRTRVDIDFNDNFREYALSQLNRLRLDLRQKIEELQAMPRGDQGPISIVSSFFLKDVLQNKNYGQALDAIGSKKIETVSVYELLGVYLLEVDIIHRLQQGLNRERLFEWENFVIAINPDSLSLDSWNNKISLIDSSKRCSILVLYYAIKKDFSTSLEYLKESDFNAKEKSLLMDYINKTKLDSSNYEKQDKT